MLWFTCWRFGQARRRTCSVQWPPSSPCCWRRKASMCPKTRSVVMMSPLSPTCWTSARLRVSVKGARVEGGVLWVVSGSEREQGRLRDTGAKERGRGGERERKGWTEENREIVRHGGGGGGRDGQENRRDLVGGGGGGGLPDCGRRGEKGSGREMEWVSGKYQHTSNCHHSRVTVVVCQCVCVCHACLPVCMCEAGGIGCFGSQAGRSWDNAPVTDPPWCPVIWPLLTSGHRQTFPRERHTQGNFHNWGLPRQSAGRHLWADLWVKGSVEGQGQWRCAAGHQRSQVTAGCQSVC